MAEIAQIIKSNYRGALVYKHSEEDFMTGTQLIVHEYEEAIFFMNGQALDLFGPGRHTLETQNLPLVSKYLKRVTGDKTPFHCEVYFINKTEQMAIKWGTDSKVEYMEPTYGFPLKVGASGEMNIRAGDSRKLLLKVVGDSQGVSQEALTRKLRMFLMTRFKTYFARLIKAEKINIFEIDEHLTTMSEALQDQLAPDFSEYGVSLTHFFVTTIVKPDGDRQYEKFRELHFQQYASVAEARLRQQVQLIDQQTDKEKMILEAEGIAAKRRLEGYSYQDERGFDVAERIAQNESTGEFVNMGVGMGMMTGVGGAVGGIMQDSLGNVTGGALGIAGTPSQRPEAQICGKCGGGVPGGAKFCPHCGASTTPECPSCGAKISGGARFCAECGQNLQGGEKNEG